MGRLTQLPAASRLSPASGAAAGLNFRLVEGRVLVTNDAGHHADLAPDDFGRLVEGRLAKDEPLWAELQAKGFLREHLDLPALARTWRQKNAFLWWAPALHIVVVSLRCNHKCLYCHASVVGEDRTDLDMTLETAKNTVDFIFSSPNPSIVIEFQGGEPLINWPVIEFVTRYARERNKREGRNLFIALVSNFSMMDEAKFKFLVDNQVSVCTSLDGPEALHNKNRIFRTGNSYGEVVRWLKRFQEAAEVKGGTARHFKPGALLTTTRFSFDYPEQIVDAYVELGLPTLCLRPMSPIGFARRVWGKIGYSPAEFMGFYRRAMDRVFAVNRRGKRLAERGAVLLLTKILKLEDPGYVDLRSPSGGGLGVLGYNYNGDVFTGDEGRMLAQEGDDFFLLGNVAATPYNDVIAHAANRACAASSTLEAQPLCSQCAYRPYCGACPVFNIETQQSVWGQMPSNGRCQTYMGLFDFIFEKLRDPETRRIFETWLVPDPSELEGEGRGGEPADDLRTLAAGASARGTP